MLKGVMTAGDEARPDGISPSDAKNEPRGQMFARFAVWWSWGESNSRPKTSPSKLLRVQVMHKLPADYLHNQSKSRGRSVSPDADTDRLRVHVHHII